MHLYVAGRVTLSRPGPREKILTCAVVRVIRPDAKWNQTTLVSSHDTIAAYFLGEGATAKLYKVSSGRYFTLVIFIFTLGMIIDMVRENLQIPAWFWIIIATNLVWGSSTIFLFSNRFLLLENLRCFETWYVCLQGFVSSICVIHGRWEEEPIYACYNGLELCLCYSLLSVCDAFNPQHKSIALRITLAVAIIVLAANTYSHVHGSFPPGFQVKEYRFGSGWTTTNNSLLIRCNLVMILFLVKFLFRMVMFPDKLVIIKSDMVNNKRTMSELQKELSETRMKHRTSQLPSMKMQHQIRKDSSQARPNPSSFFLFFFIV